MSIKRGALHRGNDRSHMDIASYLPVLTAHIPIFAIGLEVPYALIVVRAVGLGRQPQISAKPAGPDRSFKSIRAAQTWLLVARAIVSFFIPYGVLIHHYLGHSNMGTRRDAFTTRFIRMIIGIAWRMVPIPAGIDASQLSSLCALLILIQLATRRVWSCRASQISFRR